VQASKTADGAQAPREENNIAICAIFNLASSQGDIAWFAADELPGQCIGILYFVLQKDLDRNTLRARNYAAA
jgi:hypothetical protein